MKMTRKKCKPKLKCSNRRLKCSKQQNLSHTQGVTPLIIPNHLFVTPLNSFAENLISLFALVFCWVNVTCPYSFWSIKTATSI